MLLMLLVLLTTACGHAEPRRPAEPAAAPGPGWRTETWGTLSVDVPDDWGYGSAPFEVGGGLGTCPPGSTGGPDDPGWVGRPILLSDVCEGYPRLTGPTAPYVWLGPRIPPGVVRYDGGLVQVTVDRFGARLTVAAADAALRKRILDSARPADHCRAGVATGPEVCGYRREGDRLVLAYAAGLTPQEARAALDAVAAAPPAKPCRGRRCDRGDGDLVRVSDGRRTAEFDLTWSDRTVRLDGGPPRRVTDAATGPWFAPGLRWTLRAFIGPQG
jgi:hypothetical protein